MAEEFEPRLIWKTHVDLSRRTEFGNTWFDMLIIFSDAYGYFALKGSVKESLSRHDPDYEDLAIVPSHELIVSSKIILQK